MRYFIFVVMVFGSTNLFSQSFEEKYRFLMPMFDEVVGLAWADIDGDSLPDAVVGYKKLGQFKVMAFQNGEIDPWPVHELVSTSGMDAINFQLIDFDKNGLLDVVIENDSEFLAHAYQNKGNFLFQASTGWGSREVFNRGLQYVDLNNDAQLDTIWTDGATLSILSHKDTMLQEIRSFLVHDFDNNGFPDIAFSGINFSNEPFTFLWYFGNSHSIINRTYVADRIGNLATGDLNHDGRFDLVISGNDGSGGLKTIFLQNQGKSFTKSGETTGLHSANILIADFTSDGLADVSFFGKDASNQNQNWIKTFQGDSIIIDNELALQDFGDYDQDGDLDRAYIAIDSLYVETNTFGTNSGAYGPVSSIALPVFNRIFFYWTKSNDDHTPIPSLTYDLKIRDAETTILSADFDDQHRHRLRATHGNRGTNNFALLKIPARGGYEIQGVDNSFATFMALNGGSTCTGGLPSLDLCGPTVEVQTIMVCGDSPVTLTPPAPQAMWFSFKEGFMGIADSYTLHETEADTVFSFNPSANASCSSLRLFTIEHSATDTLRFANTRYDCKDRNITLEVDAEWRNVMWKNNMNATSVAAQSIVYAFQQEMIFTTTAINDFGCALKETFDLKISKPNLQLNGTHFQIIKGNSVQLSATGGSFYEWSPVGSLSNHLISSPVATPTETTEFTVVALDSLGCSAQGNLVVEVKEEAFIPTLFTPNGDNRNDNLRIYGLTYATDFYFAIYNREGSRLYETSSVSEATQSGWSGVVNGVAQPAGTYYWKVEGRVSKNDLQFNGKKNGAFLLVR